jgi:hypothetical protein
MEKSPSTPHFGGCYRNMAIRTELLAQAIKQQHRVSIDTKTLLKIEKVTLYFRKIKAKQKHLGDEYTFLKSPSL